MSRHARIQKTALASLALASIASWWGCNAGGVGNTTASTSSQGGGTSTSTATGTGATDITIDSGTGGNDEDSGPCTSTSAEARRVPLDMIVVIDQSASMSGPKWVGTTVALASFFNDPASAAIGVGLTLFPNDKVNTCNPLDYQVLDVPIGPLPSHTFALVNALPADAKGNSTPTFGALKGALQAATAYQDAHPTHKVIVVLATDGDPNSCGMTNMTDIANLAKNAKNYNGVHTYVIGVQGSIITNLNKIAAAGGTGAAYDVTQDISQFSARMADIRTEALGCEFELPDPPNQEALDPNRVNFTYTPKGVGTAKTLLRADDLADCGGKPGWYYDSNKAPTKIILCPSSCSTVSADTMAKVDVLFGCESLIN